MGAELFGRRDGYCKGKGGSMHIADFDVGMLGANGIVGAGLPITAGAGVAAQLEGSDAVAVGFFGDGATGEGPCHESLNIASLWKLPVIWVCENNQYAVDTPVAAGLSATNVADLAAGYNMPGHVVDGNDVLAVYSATKEAVRRARAGEGPTLLECKTWRRHQHALRDVVNPDRRPPELALVDIGLPGMDGWELGGRLRERCGPDLRLVALTGYGQEGDRERSQAAVFGRHLVKPLDPDELDALLTDLFPPAEKNHHDLA